MKSTRDFGNELEQYVANLFISIYKYARPTVGSGAKAECGDIQNPWFIIECKNRNTKDITIKQDTWLKLKNEIPLHSSRLPLYILRNSEKNTLVCLELSDFIEIFKRSLENE